MCEVAPEQRRRPQQERQLWQVKEDTTEVRPVRLTVYMCVFLVICLPDFLSLALSLCYSPGLPSTTLQPAVTISVWRHWWLVVLPSTPLTSGGALPCITLLPQTWIGGEGERDAQ